MARDLVMDDGDHVLGEDGNYETTETAAGKMQRLYRAKYGAWPGGRGKKMGRQYQDRPKWSAKDKARWISDTEECFQPLVASGDIKDLSVVEIEGSRRDTGYFRITATDVRTKRKITIEPDPVPWGN